MRKKLQLIVLFNLALSYGCSIKEKNPKKDIVKDFPILTVNLKDTVLIEKKDTEENKRINLPDCYSTNEINEIRKIGTLEWDEALQHLSCSYKNNNVLIKINYNNCKIKSRKITSETSVARSYSKYHDNKLVIFDSVNETGEKIISFYYGVIGFDDDKVLPKYLKK